MQVQNYIKTREKCRKFGKELTISTIHEKIVESRRKLIDNLQEKNVENKMKLKIKVLLRSMG